jgi:hypothetical protein
MRLQRLGFSGEVRGTDGQPGMAPLPSLRDEDVDRAAHESH